MPAAELPTCVFCGQPIEPADESAGRAPMAAHASCADAALADDAHWDDISSAGAGNDGGGAPEPRRAGCLATTLVILLLFLVLVA